MFIVYARQPKRYVASTIGLRVEHLNMDSIIADIVINPRDYNSLGTIETYF